MYAIVSRVSRKCLENSCTSRLSAVSVYSWPTPRITYLGNSWLHPGRHEAREASKTPGERFSSRGQRLYLSLIAREPISSARFLRDHEFLLGLVQHCGINYFHRSNALNEFSFMYPSSNIFGDFSIPRIREDTVFLFAS